MARRWVEANLKLLINIVREYEKIWNTTHPGFTKSKILRHIYWKEITKLFNESPDNEKYFTRSELLRRWNNLRLRFEIEHKKLTKLDGYAKSSWPYYDMLTFLTSHPMEKRKSAFGKKYALQVKTRVRDEVSIGSVLATGVQNENEYEAEEMSTNAMNCFDNEHICVKLEASAIDEEDYILEQSQVPTECKRDKLEMNKSFGSYLARELMYLEGDLQFKAKKIIFNVLTDLQYEQEQRSKVTQTC